MTLDLSNAPLTKHGTPPAHVELSKAEKMLHWAYWGVVHRDNFVYTMGATRSEMFNRTPGDTHGLIHADCSQFYSAIEHWSGGHICNEHDYTGSLLDKGVLRKSLALWKPSDCVIWGPGHGEHAAMLVEKISAADWWTIGFGHSPGAPNRVRLSDMTKYMTQHGHPGVRVLGFA